MSTTTIGGINAADDKFYRYKRSIITVTYIKKRGGTTFITNLEKISKELQMDYKKLSLLFSKNIRKILGVSCNKNTINAIISVDQLEEVLNKIIDKYLLCKSKLCRLPEWNGKVCKACGYTKPTKNTKDDEEEGEEREEEEEEVSSYVDNKVNKFLKEIYLYPESQQKQVIIDECWDCDNKKKLKLLKKHVKIYYSSSEKV